MFNRVLLSVFVIIFLIITSSYSQSREEKRIKASDEKLQSIASEIPDTILSKALGFAIVPNFIRAGAGVSGFRGQGVLSIKMQDGCWSYPSFISFHGLAVGLQAGGQITDVVLIFTSKRSIDAFADGKVSLGSGVSVEPGPLRSKGEPGKNADIYYYAKNKGAYVGASFDGASINIDSNANEKFYDLKDITYEKIMQNQIKDVPESSEEFKKNLVKVAGGC